MGLPVDAVDADAEDDDPDHDALHRGGQASVGRRTHEKWETSGGGFSDEVSFSGPGVSQIFQSRVALCRVVLKVDQLSRSTFLLVTDGRTRSFESI